MNLKVSEVFYSLQGEGARAGCPSVFVRLADCNLTCTFCDTEFASGKTLTIECLEGMMLLAMENACGRTVDPSEGNWIVWTGGEPTLQLLAEHVAFFKSRGWKQAIETNGTQPVPPGIDWIACSPKVAEHVLIKNFPDGLHGELRYVRHSGQPGVPKPAVRADRYFLSPMFKGNHLDPENLQHCIKLCLANPQWSLSVQTHKFFQIL